MILKDDCTERPLLAIEVRSAEVETCNMRLFHPPLGLSIFYGSRDQLRPGSLLHKRKEPGNEVAGTLSGIVILIILLKRHSRDSWLEIQYSMAEKHACRAQIK